MPETLDAPTAPPLTMDDVQQLIGALYLELHLLRRQVLQLRTYIDQNGRTPSAPSAPDATIR
jgi:hypothetical protein